MTLNLALKSLLSFLLEHTGIIQRKTARLGQKGHVILMYHRVLKPEDAVNCCQSGVYTHTATFESHLKYLGTRFAVVSLHDLYLGRLSNPAPSKPVCILTFDDGWKDFYTDAYPLLKRYRVPATVFLPTDYIGTDHQFWTDRLAFFLGHLSNAERKFARDSLSGSILALKGPQNSRLEKAISILKKSNIRVIEDTISEIAQHYSTLEAPPAGRHFLNWDEVREMKSSGLVSFGSHTAGHEILTNLNAAEVMDELEKSKQKLLSEGAVGTDFIPFSYPNGNFTPEIAALVRAAGYSLAVTTKRGWNDEPQSPFALFRVAIHQDITSTTPLFGCRISGIF